MNIKYRNNLDGNYCVQTAKYHTVHRGPPLLDNSQRNQIAKIQWPGERLRFDEGKIGSCPCWGAGTMKEPGTDPELGLEGSSAGRRRTHSRSGNQSSQGLG